MSDRTSAASPNEVNVGLHLFRWEEPDVGYLRYDGDVDVDVAAEISDRSREYTLGKPRVFLIVDVGKVGKVSSAARARSAQGSKDLRLRGIAVIGASAILRTLMSLVSRAVDLLNSNHDNPTRFFDSEAAARAWIAARRQQIQHD